MTDRLPAELRIAIVCGALALAAFSSLVATAGSNESGAKVAVEDADLARVEQLFSQRPNTSGSAPRTWSSRLETRWTARWELSPQYAA